MNNELDSETLKIKRDGQTIADFVKSDGWNLAKTKLLELIRLTDSLSTTVFENKTPEQIAIEIQARANSVQLINEWIADVEGTAHQHQSNQEVKSTEDDIIVRL